MVGSFIRQATVGWMSIGVVTAAMTCLVSNLDPIVAHPQPRLSARSSLDHGILTHFRHTLPSGISWLVEIPRFAASQRS